MCAPASQARPQPSEGELSDEDSALPARKRHRSRSPQGEADIHQQELDPSYVEMLNAIRGLLDLEVPQVECLVEAPQAGGEKTKSGFTSCSRYPLHVGLQVQEGVWNHSKRQVQL